MDDGNEKPPILDRFRPAEIHESVQTVSDRLAEFVERVNNNDERIFISVEDGEEPVMVLMSWDDLESLEFAMKTFENTDEFKEYLEAERALEAQRRAEAKAVGA